MFRTVSKNLNVGPTWKLVVNAGRWTYNLSQANVYILPPNCWDANCSDEDSGEDDATSMNNLGRRHFQADAKYTIHLEEGTGTVVRSTNETNEGKEESIKIFIGSTRSRESKAGTFPKTSTQSYWGVGCRLTSAAHDTKEKFADNLLSRHYRRTVTSEWDQYK